MKFVITKWCGESYTIMLTCNPNTLYTNNITNTYFARDLELINPQDIAYCINKYINITADKYVQILSKHNVRNYGRVYYFENIEDAKKAVETLNEKYLIILNLMGVE